MTEHDIPPSAQFLNKVRDFLALQAHFSRQFNLLPSHWLTLYSALASVRFEHGQWICNEFSTAEIARDSLTSRETVRRSMQWLVAKGLIIRTNRRFALTAVTLSEIRNVLDRRPAGPRAQRLQSSNIVIPAGNNERAQTAMLPEKNI